MIVTPAPQSLFDHVQHTPQLGLYQGLIGEWNWQESILNRWKKKVRFKRWCFVSVQNQDWVLSCAVVDLGYINVCFAYFLDLQTKELLEYRVKGSANLITAQGDFLNGHFQLNTSDLQLDMLCAFDYTQQKYEMKLNFLAAALKNKKSFGGHFEISSDSSAPFMQVVAPMERLTLTTTKNCTLKIQNPVLFRQHRKETITSPVYASIDITAGYPKRTTRWNWLSFSGQSVEGEVLGANLCKGIYPQTHPENAIFYKNKIFFLDVELKFEWRERLNHWHIFSEDEQVNLRFSPIEKIVEDTDAVLVATKFEHYVGQLNGWFKINDSDQEKKLEVNWPCALFEDHFAKW